MLKAFLCFDEVLLRFITSFKSWLRRELFCFIIILSGVEHNLDLNLEPFYGVNGELDDT